MSAVSVRWSGWSGSLAECVRRLHSSSDAFTDVTLVAEGRSVRAHRLVLAAGSSLFSDIFQQNPIDHPIIILQDIDYSILLMLLSYIYNGEVNVPELLLPNLVKAANYLQIQGLCFTSNDNAQDENTNANIDFYKESDVLTPSSSCYIKNEITSDAEDVYENEGPRDDDMSDMVPVEAIIKEEVEEQVQSDISCPTKRKRKSGRNNKKTEFKNPKIDFGNAENTTDCVKDYELSIKEHNILNLYQNVLSNIQTDNETDVILQDTFLSDNLTSNCEDRNVTCCLNSTDAPKDENIRPTFPCPFCHRTYYSWGYRRRHVKSHHESNSLTCKLCFSTLDSEVMWFDHTVNVHQIPHSQARDSLVIMVEAHSVLTFSSPPSPITMLHHLQLKSASSGV